MLRTKTISHHDDLGYHPNVAAARIQNDTNREIGHLLKQGYKVVGVTMTTLHTPVDYGVHSRGLAADGEHRLTPMTSIVYDVPQDLETDAADRERGDTSYLSGSEALLR